MSDCFHIGCENCLVSLWIGQGNRHDWTSYRHYNTEEASKAFAKFLFSHKGHNLIFDDSDSSALVYDYQELQYLPDEDRFHILEEDEEYA